MDSYDVQQVCLNGHQITDNYNLLPGSRKDFCDICGERTIYACTACSAPIRGQLHIEGWAIASSQVPVPDYCHNCGSAHPWTEKGAQSQAAISLSDSLDAIRLIEQICTRFHLVAKQLRTRHEDRATLDVSDEYDVQDLLHALLKLHFDDIRPEEWTPSYAGKSSRMDFLLKDESIVIEVKKTRDGLSDREVGTQLIEDIARYREHPHCKTLICFVYDPDDGIANPNGLENDLTRNEDRLCTKVIVSPKGY